MTPRKPKDQGKNSEPNSVVLVPRPNGKGALLSGGKPGNKGGGRPLDRIRHLALSGLEQAMPKIVELAKGSAVLATTDEKGNTSVTPLLVKHTDQINAAKLLLDTGGGNRIVQSDVQARILEQFACIKRMCPAGTTTYPADLGERIIQAFDQIWRVPVQTNHEAST